MKVEITVYEGIDIPPLLRQGITDDEFNKRKKIYVDELEQATRRLLELHQKDSIKYTVIWKDVEGALA